VGLLLSLLGRKRIEREPLLGCRGEKRALMLLLGHDTAGEWAFGHFFHS
jgi:hypothetical protein